MNQRKIREERLNEIESEYQNTLKKPKHSPDDIERLRELEIEIYETKWIKI